MEPTAPRSETVFVVKEEQEHCFVWPGDDPVALVHAVHRDAGKADSGITREEATEVLEGIVPERLRAI